MPLVTDGKGKARKAEKIAAPIKPAVSPEVEYRRALLNLNRLLKAQTRQLGDLVKNGERPSAVATQIERELERANREFDAAAQRLAASTTEKLARNNKDKVERALRKALGVNSATLIDTPEIRDIITATTQENVALIKSIPEEHFARVSQAVFANYAGQPIEGGSLAKRLQQIGGITDRRAKFIARDQTAKFVSSLNAARQQEAGIDGYIWRNAGDNRVVGKPGGLYPEGTRGHGNHWDREGKTFSWDSPPPDGHPGMAFNCRCFAEPVINIEKVRDKALT